MIVTSATLEMKLFADYFHGCPTVEIPGKTFPVEIFYQEMDTLEKKTFELAVAKVQQIHIETPISSGDILCFLTGQEEVFASVNN